MSGWEGMRRVFRLGLGGGDADREVDRELAHHFEATVEELRGRGLEEAAARAEARRRFGDERRYRRELRRLARGRDRRERAGWAAAGVGSAVAAAFRGMARAPGLSVAVVLVIGLGVGVNATMFAMLDRLFLRAPAHVEDPEAVRRVFLTRSFNGNAYTSADHTYPDFRDWAELEAFGDVAAYSARELTVGTGESAERRPATLATANFFPLLGARPALGRWFGPSDDAFGAEKVVVLGHAYWRTRYGGSPSVVGEAVEAGGATYTVVGVAPEGFTGVGLERVDLWLPLHAAGEVEEGGREWLDARGWYWVSVIGRLAPGVSPEAAAEAATVAHLAARSEQAQYDREARVTVEPLQLARTSLATREARVVPWLTGVGVLVLLLTCANVANLLLARGIQRRRDAAVRVALGAGRGRLIGGTVAEAVLLAVLGGGAAYARSIGVGTALQSFLLPGVDWAGGSDRTRVLLVSGALAVAAGLLAGLAPAVRSARATHLTADLRSTGRGSTRGRSPLRASLTVFQAAVSVVLLVGTGLFVLSLRNARDVDLGFDPGPVLRVRLQPAGPYPGGEAMERLYREARQALEGLPGVESSTIVTTTPFSNSRGIGDDLRIPGLDSLPQTAAGKPYIHAVTDGYLETMGTRLVRGRGIERADDAESAPPVALVNETMARLAWPGEDPIGRCLVMRDGPCTRVVGVVADSRRFGLEENEAMQYYVPLAHAPYPWPPSSLMLRTARPAALAAPARAALLRAMPALRLVGTEPFASSLAGQYRAWRLGAMLFGGFGLLALLVASLGLYSVLAFDVAQRRTELGIRGALGATRSAVVGLVLRDGMRLAVPGVAIGLATAAVAAGRVEPLLFHVPARPPALLAAVALAMILVAAVASVLPALRASRVPPAEALGAE